MKSLFLLLIFLFASANPVHAIEDSATDRVQKNTCNSALTPNHDLESALIKAKKFADRWNLRSNWITAKLIDGVPGIEFAVRSDEDASFVKAMFQAEGVIVVVITPRLPDPLGP